MADPTSPPSYNEAMDTPATYPSAPLQGSYPPPGHQAPYPLPPSSQPSPYPAAPPAGVGQPSGYPPAPQQPYYNYGPTPPTGAPLMGQQQQGGYQGQGYQYPPPPQTAYGGAAHYSQPGPNQYSYNTVTVVAPGTTHVVNTAGGYAPTLNTTSQAIQSNQRRGKFIGLCIFYFFFIIVIIFISVSVGISSSM